MSNGNTEPTSLLRTLFELTKPYDKYISFVIIVIWIYVRSQIKAKEIKKQEGLEKFKSRQAEEKSTLDRYFPKAKPFHPSDVLVKTESESELDNIQTNELAEEDSDISLVENPDTDVQSKDSDDKKNEDQFKLVRLKKFNIKWILNYLMNPLNIIL